MFSVAGVSATGATAQSGNDRTREALGFVVGLLANPGKHRAALPVLLGELARAFGAKAAALAGPLGSLIAVQTRVDGNGRLAAGGHCPWEDRPELLEQMARAAVAVPVQGADQKSWLLTNLGSSDEGGWVLWLEDADGRSWSPTETAALALAGQALARLADAGLGATGLARALERARYHSRFQRAAGITGRLAHDFGNVLTAIQGFAELSRAQLPSDSLPRRYVNEILQSSEAGARWIQQLQTFSRRRSEAFVPAALPVVVAEEQARLRGGGNGAVALHVALPAHLPLVALDAESLREVLNRLLDNAFEAIAGPGVVSLSARVTELTEHDCHELLGTAGPGAHVEVTIADSGRGITPQTRGRLLKELFFSTKPRHRGLGLAVVYGILQAYRGGLRFGPEPEKGTAVRIFLPTAEPVVPAAQPPGRQTPTTARVLVVDDDPLTLQFLSSVLESAGYRVRAAPGAAEALGAYTSAREPFDLVVTDVAMPQTDGFELVRRLRNHDGDVNVLFISSQVQKLGRAEDDTLRQFGWLPKPFRPEALLEAVQHTLAHKRNGLTAQKPPVSGRA